MNNTPKTKLKSENPPMKKIAPLSLAKFKKPNVENNRNIIWRASWYVTSAFFFQSRILALIPSSFKAHILRFFGGVIGNGLVCKPNVTIKYPWFLTLGDHVWIGEDSWIDNLSDVRIGNDVCLSQGTRLLTGSHNWNFHDFPFFSKNITIGDGVWVTGFRTIRPGVCIPSNVVVLQDLPFTSPNSELD